jgi:hypothetical protein
MAVNDLARIIRGLTDQSRDPTMSANVIQFPRRAHADAKPKPPLMCETPVIDRLSNEFLKQAVNLHGQGESGADVYMGMIMALCKLICRTDDDPAVIDQRLAASHTHMLEVRELLAAGGEG